MHGVCLLPGVNRTGEGVALQSAFDSGDFRRRTKSPTPRRTDNDPSLGLFARSGLLLFALGFFASFTFRLLSGFLIHPFFFGLLLRSGTLSCSNALAPRTTLLGRELAFLFVVGIVFTTVVASEGLSSPASSFVIESASSFAAVA